jgi:hypothetical protein
LYEKSKTAKKDKLIVVQEPVYKNGSYAISEIRSQDNKTDGLLV